MDVFVNEFTFTSFILVHEPKEMCLSLNPRDYFFSIVICHGSDMSTEDGNIACVALKVNSEKSDYS